MDVDTAFLYVPIDEPNWVKVPDDTNFLPGDSGIYILLLLLFNNLFMYWKKCLDVGAIWSINIWFEQQLERLEANPMPIC